MVVILQPVINRLKELFPDIRVEIDRQKQGVTAPCFFINLVRTELIRQFDDRFFLNNTVNINYLRCDEDDLFRLEEIRFTLLTGMEQVRLNNIGVTCENLETKIIDGDLVMTFDLNVWMEKVKMPDSLMRRLKQEGLIKNG